MPEPAAHSALRRAYDATYGRLFARGYDRMMRAAEEAELGRRRAEVVSRARGRTLEIGAGTGLNLRHYTDAVSDLVQTEPFGPMAVRLRRKVAAGQRSSQVVVAPAERLPFEDQSFDTVVSTLVLCTVEDPAAALVEIDRVLRPGGSLEMLEHVRAPTPGLARAQDVLHGPWWAIGHGCHCNRDTLAAIEASPLGLDGVERHEVRGVSPLVKPMVVASARSG